MELGHLTDDGLSDVERRLFERVLYTLSLETPTTVETKDML